MKNIFFKYIAPGFIALSLIGHFYTSNIKGLPECDSNATMIALKKINRMGEIDVTYATPASDGVNTSENYQMCGTAVTYTDSYGVSRTKAMYFNIQWKDKKKRQVVITNIQRY